MKRSRFPWVLAGIVCAISLCFGEAKADLKLDRTFRKLPLTEAAPNSRHLFMEARYVYPQTRLEIGFINPETGAEFAWALPEDVLVRGRVGGLLEPPAIDHRNVSWASSTGAAIVVNQTRAYVVDLATGSLTETKLTMPGKLPPYQGMGNYALSFNGEYVAYSLYTRDRGDVQPDGFGKLYVDLFVQKLTGSQPRRVATKGYTFLPDWSPDGQRIAYVGENNSVVVADIAGKVLSRIPYPEKPEPYYLRTTDIRWSPDGQKIAFVANKHLYLVASDGTGLIRMFREDIDAVNVAWSPDGKEIAFRSSHEAGQDCEYNLIRYFEVGSFYCMPKYHVYVSEIANGKPRRVTRDPEYYPGRLFWIR